MRHIITAVGAAALALGVTACDPSVQAAPEQPDPTLKITFNTPSPEEMERVNEIFAEDARINAEHERRYGKRIICEDHPTDPFIAVCRDNPDYTGE